MKHTVVGLIAVLFHFLVGYTPIIQDYLFERNVKFPKMELW